MPEFKDRTGERFGDWTLVTYELVNKLPGWHCRCTCGQERWVRTSNLVAGKSTGCGCQAETKMRATKTARGSIDLLAKQYPREYSSWANMWTRCTNPVFKGWSDYGGRGIAVTPEWKSFARFLQEVGPRPSPGLSLDRIDNDGNYEPGNVRWATRSEQALNKRKRRPHKRGPYKRSTATL